MVLNFWFVVAKELTAIVERLQECLGLDDLKHDYEDTWEWITATNKTEELDFNISRKHDCGKGDYKEPVRVMVRKNDGQITDETIAELGVRMARCLETKVFYGQVRFLSGDQLEFIEQKEYWR